MSILKVFPTQLWQASLKVSDSLNNDLTQDCYTFAQIDDEGRKWSKKNYVKGYTSYGSIADLHLRSSIFAELKTKIDKEVLKYAQALDMNLKGRKLVMTKFWINIMGEHSHHSFHLHPLAAISGTYYVKLPKNSGGFRIEDPRIACFMGSPPRIDRAKEENLRYLTLQPKERSILLFESWLKHEVPANRSKEERISLSFNYE